MAYLASHIINAGGAPTKMLSLDAVKLIYEYSGGIPRTINVICDNTLVSGMALGRSRIGRAFVVEVARNLWLKGERPPASSQGFPPEPVRRSVAASPRLACISR